MTLLETYLTALAAMNVAERTVRRCASDENRRRYVAAAANATRTFAALRSTRPVGIGAGPKPLHQQRNRVVRDDGQNQSYRD